MNSDTYRIMSDLKIETDIITSIASSLIERAVILVMMYVATFITDIIILISNTIMYSTSYWQIKFSASEY
jgi:hypothetical protein